ncbi:MAG: DUF4270 family protein [Bacteroidetes bacterium]|uniref:DUF4270 domain-containing protein n=1 Tax=Phaeocystidibacter marisrubri TaxID=1577780 RepID=A0A6L3ZEZ5_9FLAO|nr:DUF4270 family protein [Phaeocystidibacter marisrubri]KAB2816176.1 DUF4270 domain-containing protein [Phaeocystidibacter marisrubri]TNE26321.1 MAG: DUF4270 family protein [Bacteroidota bacterium]GGH67703.1 hypothetical protein GCM10011318_06970 [Phaeocystidibacter marisrubri]
MKRNTLYSLTTKAIVSMALVVFVGCERGEAELGLPYVDGDQLNFGQMERTPIITYTAPFDSVRSNSPTSGIGLVGGYDDNVFGRTDAKLVTHLVPSGVPTFGTNPICDSVVLFIPYTVSDAGYYGDTTVPFNMSVKTLKNYLDPDSSYYSNRSFATDVEIGNATIAVRPRTPRDWDHLSASRPVLRVPLNTSFGQNVIFPLEGSNAFDNTDNFISTIYGIELSGDASTQAILGLLVPSTDSKVRFYFRNDEMDTSHYDLRMSTSTEFVSTFTHDYSTAAFDIDNQDSTNGEVACYSQAMAGVVTMVKIPNLRHYQDSAWILTRAELNIPVKEGSAVRHRLPDQMQIVVNDTAGRTVVSDYISEGASAVGGTLVTGELRDHSYKFVITRQMQRFLDDKDFLGEFIIVPNNSSSDQSRAVLNGNGSTLEPAELKLYYSRTN